MISFDNLLKTNTNWWQARDGSPHFFEEGYTVNSILKENPSSVALIDLNRYIITIGSQDGTCESQSSLVSLKFLKWRDLEHLKEIPGREFQRPYLQFLCKRGLETELLKLQNYGIACYVDHRYVYNDLFKSKFRTATQVNFTKTVFDNEIETYYTNFNVDGDYLDYSYGFIKDAVYVTMIANDYGDSNSDMLEALLTIVKDYYKR